MTRLRHRPEIDGLRALAVLPVVLFHARLGFPGGFVGVDVFFVISGFLITSLITHELDEGTFTLAGFWERRVRRIVPAVAAVVLGCFIAAEFILFPDDFSRFARSAVAQAALLSNVYFFRHVDYFGTGAANPLLHTWSLAVEEQFYLLYPWILLAAHRFVRPALRPLLAAAGLVSFGLCLIETRRNPSAAFYLLPYRAWELLLGGTLAVTPGLIPESRWMRETAGAIGVLAIVAATLCFNDGMAFPGYAALLPCLGAAAIIASNNRALTVVGRLLALRPVAFVGLISYSLYLWHWPLLTFAAYRAGVPLSPLSRALLVAASFGLAALSWNFVETPIRRRRWIAGRAGIFAAAGFALASLAACGFLVRRLDGLPGRWPPAVLRYLAARNDFDFRHELGLRDAQAGELVPLGPNDPGRPVGLLVWGDSHAMAVLHVLNDLCAEYHVRGLAATHSATAPLLGLPSDTRYSLRGDTMAYNEAVLELVRRRRIPSVLLIGVWDRYAENASEKFRECLLGTVDALHAAGTRVYIMKDVPRLPFDVPTALAEAALAGRNLATVGVPIGGYRTQDAYVNGLIDAAAAAGEVTVIDPVPLFTDASGFYRVDGNGSPRYFDYHHLSIHGATELRPVFLPMFQALARADPSLARIASSGRNALGAAR